MILSSIQYQSKTLTVGLDNRSSTREFRQLGLDRENRPPRHVQSAFVGVSLFGRDHFTLSMFRQRGDESVEYASASYSGNLGRRAFIHLTTTSTLCGQKRAVFSAGLTFQPWERTSVSSTVTRHNGETDVALAAQRNLPLGTGVGYRFLAERGSASRAEGEVQLRTETNEFQLEASQTEFGRTLRGSVQGAIGFLGGKIFATRRISDSFAVVKAGDYEGVHVFSENQPIAVTGKDGTAVVPRLLSYQVNHLSIDPTDLPLDATMNDSSLNARAGRRTGVLVEFPVSMMNGVLLKVVEEAGEPIRTPATLTLQGKSESFPIGYSGIAYITGFVPGRTLLTVTWKGGSCRATVDLQEEPRGLAEKRVTCHPTH